MELVWHRYKYYDYEKSLALREISVLLAPDVVEPVEGGLDLRGIQEGSSASRLVYFAGERSNNGVVQTTQSRLEVSVGGNGGRQSTRYSSHALHEYKGRFNPQIAKLLLNIFDVKPGQRVLDPFCGSGTSLVECAHLGIEARGMDINPLAVYLANAKISALSIPAAELQSIGLEILEAAEVENGVSVGADERSEYLRAWFEPKFYQDIERLRAQLLLLNAGPREVLSAIASNLLRDYSLQEPGDLRIRRRKSPYPKVGFFDAYREAVTTFCTKVGASQSVLGRLHSSARACEWDSRTIAGDQWSDTKFDSFITSPPYATALPYIDTQRLSLVWLGLLPPSRIAALEADLVGSREVRGTRKADLLLELMDNRGLLPDCEADLCRRLQASVSPEDGFRRKAVPLLLYRYFKGMGEVFSSTRAIATESANFGLVVGGNHTVLGGERFDINTPKHLASVAESRGWRHVETIPLQTYKRFGLHAHNATTSEALVILSAS